MNAHRQSRKRGVQASRPKLYHALTAAGLKTQAALAERIADLEELESAPKDIVNRVFRELPVEPQTLERIARALGTQAYKLYKTAHDPEEPAAPNPASEAPAATAAPGAPDDGHRGGRRTGGRTAVLVAAAVVAVVFGAALMLAWPPGMDTAPQIGTSAARTAANVLGLGPPTLTVQPFRGDPSGKVGAAVREALSRHFKVASATAAILTGSLDARAATERMRTALAVEGEVLELGRFTAVRGYLFSTVQRRPIWAESIATAQLDEALPAIADKIANAVRHATGMPLQDDERPGHFPLASVQDDYLRGLWYLDRPPSELNIRRAQARFEAALRQDANYARGHAGLCESLLEEYWLEDAQRALTGAARACGRALQLEPADPRVRIAHGGFLLRTGRTEESIDTYEQVLESAPGNASALTGLAAAYLHLHRQAAKPGALPQAMASARAAADADPRDWKALFSLAAMHYFDGDIPGAIRTSREALERDTNEYILANLGTLHFCAGELEQARDSYLQARELAPGSYVGDEFLGLLHYQLGDYESAAELRRRAIDAIQSAGEPEIHEMWGNLADAYWRAGRNEDALAAYRSAAAIAERDFLLGSAGISDRASRAYYYTMIHALAPEAVSAALLAEIDAELLAVSDHDMDPSPLIRLTQAWLQRGDRERARTAVTRAVSGCSGYGMAPHLAELLADTSSEAR